MIRMIKMRPADPPQDVVPVILEEAMAKAYASPMCIGSEVITAFWQIVPSRVVNPRDPGKLYVYVGVCPGYPPDEPFDENGEYPGWGNPGWGE